MDIVLRCIGKDCNGVSYNTIAVIFAYNPTICEYWGELWECVARNNS